MKGWKMKDKPIDEVEWNFKEKRRMVLLLVYDDALYFCGLRLGLRTSAVALHAAVRGSFPLLQGRVRHGDGRRRARSALPAAQLILGGHLQRGARGHRRCPRACRSERVAARHGKPLNC